MKTTVNKAVKSPVRPSGGFDAVKFMRQQRDKLSKKLSNMTKEEIIAYFKKRKAEITVRPRG